MLRKMIVLLVSIAGFVNVARGGTFATPNDKEPAITTTLAADHRASMPIIVAPGASVETKKHAATLASYLEKITGAKFEVQEGDGSTGIAVGSASDFPALKLA